MKNAAEGKSAAFFGSFLCKRGSFHKKEGDDGIVLKENENKMKRL